MDYYCVKVTFVVKYVSAMVFGGGVCKIWGNPYLNSTTVLFDNENVHYDRLSQIRLHKFPFKVIAYFSMRGCDKPVFNQAGA